MLVCSIKTANDKTGGIHSKIKPKETLKCPIYYDFYECYFPFYYFNLYTVQLDIFRKHNSTRIPWNPVTLAFHLHLNNPMKASVWYISDQDPFGSS